MLYTHRTSSMQHRIIIYEDVILMHGMEHNVNDACRAIYYDTALQSRKTDVTMTLKGGNGREGRRGIAVRVLYEEGGAKEDTLGHRQKCRNDWSSSRDCAKVSATRNKREGLNTLCRRGDKMTKKLAMLAALVRSQNSHDDQILCLFVRHQSTIDQEIPDFDPLITLQLQHLAEILGGLVGSWRIFV